MEQTKTILEKLNAGVYDERLEKLYVDPARIPGQRKRYRRAVLRFEELFGPGMAEAVSYTHLDVYKRQRVYYIGSRK